MAVVAIERCASYRPADVRRAVEASLQGALGDDLKRADGKRVLLKPNLLAAREPSRGVTTHPAVVGAAIDVLKEAGASVSVGDSPAGAVRGVRRVWENTGMLEICSAKGVPLVNFEASGSVARSVDGRSYPIAKAVLEFDYIVSLPKLKTHILTLLTGAIKNVFGCVPGFQKSSLHLANPRPDAMARAIVDVFSIVRPWVTVTDAVEAMEGDGPSSGRIRQLGFIAASTDCVALDAALSRAVGVDPRRVPTTREAERRGLGDGPFDAAVFSGLGPDEVAPDGFAVPKNWKFLLIPSFAGRLLGRLVWVRPIINEGLCTGCGDCVGVCAAHAVDLRLGKAVVDHERCISCMCCHEACFYGAVETRMSRLARLVA